MHGKGMVRGVKGSVNPTSYNRSLSPSLIVPRPVTRTRRSLRTCICAGGVSGKDSCTGDSGAPLVVPDGSGGFKQVGVVSFGGSPEQACDVPEFPGVFVKVSNFVSWIQENVPLLASVLYFSQFGNGIPGADRL